MRRLRARRSRRHLALWVVVAALGCGCKEHKASTPPPSPVKSSDDTPKAKPSGLAVGDGPWSFAHVGEAIAAIVGHEKPRVVGFGEVHQLKSSKPVLSSLARFTERAVPALAEANASNLILETWVERAECGEVQKKVDTQVRADTERPAQTESELTRLLRAVDEEDIGRHGMAMSCEEYKALLDDSGKVDYPSLLALITKKLGDKAREVLSKSPPKSLIFLYGGALHNDLYPNEGVEQWSYAKAVSEAVQGRYVEVDFFVPELIEQDKVLAKEPWFELIKSPKLDNEVLLVRRGKSSYVVLARRAVAPPPPATKPTK